MPQKKSSFALELSKTESKVFLSVLLLSGYVRLLQKHMYWEVSLDGRNEAVTNAIRRKRFDTIMRYLHFQGETDLDNRFTKVRP